MIGFTEDELTLMMLYNPGSKDGLIQELTTMQKALTGRDRNLRKWTKGALEKLHQISEQEFEELQLLPDFDFGE